MSAPRVLIFAAVAIVFISFPPVDAFRPVAFAGPSKSTSSATRLRSPSTLRPREAAVGVAAEDGPARVRTSAAGASPGVGGASSGAVPAAEDRPLAKRALLISSFTDGVLASPPSLDFLKYCLASSLAESIIREREEDVRESVIYSPCAGPDIGMLNALEKADAAVSDTESSSSSGERDYGALADGILGRIFSSDKDAETDPLHCRVLYIPTAMYALNPDSSNTPGKQRQRARADGKKRRNQVVQVVRDLLNSSGEDGDKGRGPMRKVDVLAVTLDLSDASIKQPVGSDDKSLFPSDGHRALQSWHPHLVYVEGGNTFWLTHCFEEGQWEEELRSAICGNGAAVYVGKSAGAILAGERVETATWKGWDDPSVVGSRPAYDDWLGQRGLGLAGPGKSFFPHMSDDWIVLVEEKRGPLEQLRDKDEANGRVFCLNEWEACCVDGDRRDVFLVEGERTE